MYQRLTRVALGSVTAALLLVPAGLRATQGPEAPAGLVERAELGLLQDPDLSRRLANQALALLQGKPDADLEVRAQLVLCDEGDGRNQGATEELIQSIEARLPAVHRQGLRAGLLTCRGELQETLGNSALAHSLYDQAVSVAQSVRDDEMLASALFARGHLLGLQGDFANSLADLRRSAAMFDKLQMPPRAIAVMNSIALTYNRMGDSTQAQDIFTRSLATQRAAGMRREEAITQYNLGRVAERLQQWDRARSAYAEAQSLSRDLGYSRGEGYALRGLAAVENARGHYEAALAMLDEAGRLQKQTTDARLGAVVEMARGIALRNLGRSRDARTELVAALETFRKADALDDLANAYDELARMDAELGDWRRAFQWKEAAKNTSERLLRNQVDQRFATLKVEFDTLEKEKENLALQKANASNELALRQTRRVQKLQFAVIGLTALLALMLATLAVHQRRSSLRMRQLAMTDDLTDVPNRRAVLALLAPYLADPLASPAALMILDIDRFKDINDEHGHPAGDAVLRAIAARLRACLVPPNFFGRVGGEEFLICIPDCTPERAITIAEELRLEICNIDTTSLYPSLRTITASIGITLSTPGDSTSTILQRADAALYRAKRAGRNCVVLEAMKHSARPATEIEPVVARGEKAVVVAFRQG